MLEFLARLQRMKGKDNHDCSIDKACLEQSDKDRERMFMLEYRMCQECEV